MIIGINYNGNRHKTEQMKYILAVILSLMSFRAYCCPVWTINNSKIISYSEGNIGLAGVNDSLYKFGDMSLYYSGTIKANFAEGKKGLEHFISHNLDFPAYTGICSLVIVAFIVDVEGNITYPGIIRGYDDEHDNAALKLLDKMPEWIPAVVEGEIVNSLNILGVGFIIR